MKTSPKNITRKITTLFAVIIALVMTTACGNIAGTNMTAPGSSSKASVSHSFNNDVQPNTQSTITATNYGGTQPDIIVDKPS